MKKLIFVLFFPAAPGAGASEAHISQPAQGERPPQSDFLNQSLTERRFSDCDQASEAPSASAQHRSVVFAARPCDAADLPALDSVLLKWKKKPSSDFGAISAEDEKEGGLYSSAETDSKAKELAPFVRVFSAEEKALYQAEREWSAEDGALTESESQAVESLFNIIMEDDQKAVPNIFYDQQSGVYYAGEVLDNANVGVGLQSGVGRVYSLSPLSGELCEMHSGMRCAKYFRKKWGFDPEQVDQNSNVYVFAGVTPLSEQAGEDLLVEVQFNVQQETNLYSGREAVTLGWKSSLQKKKSGFAAEIEIKQREPVFGDSDEKENTFMFQIKTPF